MPVLEQVVASLELMTLHQLLCGFLACTAYALAQGRLVGSGSRCIALLVAVVASAGFVLLSAHWVEGFMLVAFGVAGVGLFTAAVWTLSRLLSVGAAAGTFESSSTFPPAVDAVECDAQGLQVPHRAAPSH